MQTTDFVNPRDVVQHLKLVPDMRVVDMGAGSGAYTFACAEVVGEKGRVYAFDVQKDLLTRITNEARKKNLQNVDTIWADIEQLGSTRFSDNIIDVVIISNILFQLPDKNSPLKEACRIIKPDGRVVVIDWSESFGGMGPHTDDVVTAEAALELIRANGLECTQTFVPGAHHYGYICRKKI
ncbi:MAG: type 11 methyltransferase [Candidatus Kaiserbacteria bacterium]|nr:type 11 methyltransferase [Candidatus Kaiserbacteria bacterium]